MTQNEAALPLEIDGLQVRLGGMEVLRNVSLSLEAGASAFLLGSNGSGKTTLLNAIAGLVRPTAGTIRAGNCNLGLYAPAQRAAVYIARSFQHPRLAPDLTPIQHAMLALQKQHSPFALLARTRGLPWAQAEAALAAMDLAGRRNVPAGKLNHAQRKLLDVALARLSGRPILLLDEPAAGLGAAEKALLALSLSQSVPGPTTLIVEHDPDFIARLGLPIHRLDRGAIAAAAPQATVQPAMAQAMPGV